MVKKINLSQLNSVMVLIFLFLVPITSYSNQQVKLIIVYVGISFLSLLLYKWKNVCFLTNKIIFLWLTYVAVSVLSTVLFKVSSSIGISGIFYEVMYTLIILILTRVWDKHFFLCLFRNIILIIATVSLLTIFFKIDIFSFLKRGTTIDNATGGISAFFEYRHYYGLFLMAAMVVNWYYPLKNGLKNFGALFIFSLNIIFTYTRNAWFTVLIIVCLYIFKEKKLASITDKKVLYFFGLLLSLIIIYLFFTDIVNSLFESVLSRLNELKEYGNDFENVSGARGYSLQYGIQYILENWQKYFLIGGGNGFALAWLSLNPYGITRWTAAIDNQYVTTFMNTGIIGSIILFSIIIYAIKLFVSSTLKEQKAYSLIIIGFAIMMFFFDVIPFNGSPLVFWIILVCTIDSKES